MAIFTGKHVETAGIVLTILGASLLLQGISRVGALAGEALYLVARFHPQLFNWLRNFAEPDAWPGFVALGIAALFAAHYGGWRADVVIAGIFATGDGRLFDELY